MKKFTAFLALSAFIFSGCVTTQSKTQKSASQSSYEGVLPCADCSGIKTNLNIQNDKFTITEDYQGKNFTAKTTGKAMKNGEIFELTSDSGDKYFFKDNGGDVLLLASEKVAPQDIKNYTLKKIK